MTIKTTRTTKAPVAASTPAPPARKTKPAKTDRTVPVAVDAAAARDAAVLNGKLVQPPVDGHGSANGHRKPAATKPAADGHKPVDTRALIDGPASYLAKPPSAKLDAFAVYLEREVGDLSKIAPATLVNLAIRSYRFFQKSDLNK